MFTLGVLLGDLFSCRLFFISLGIMAILMFPRGRDGSLIIKDRATPCRDYILLCARGKQEN